MDPYEVALHKARKKAEQEWFEMHEAAKAMAASNGGFRNSEFQDDFIDTQTEGLAGNKSHEEFVARRIEDLMWNFPD